MIAGCFGILGSIDVANNYLGFLNRKSKIFIFTVFLIILFIGLIINSCADRYKLLTDLNKVTSKLDKVTVNRDALKTNLKKKQTEINKLQENSSDQSRTIQILISLIPSDKLGQLQNQIFLNKFIDEYKDDKK